MKIIRSLRRWTQSVGRRAVYRLCRVWAAHQDLLRDNHSYEAALAAAAAGVIVQASIERLVTALIAGLLGIWVAVRRGTTWPARNSFEDRW
jgi:hypothetical protein